MTKLKIYYKGITTDGWGLSCSPVYDGVEDAGGNDLSDNPNMVDIAKKEIDKMVKNCGEFACTLVAAGKRDYIVIDIRD